MAEIWGSGELQAQSATVAATGVRAITGTGNLRAGLSGTVTGKGVHEPKVLVQAVLTEVRDKTAEGELIRCVQIPWLAVVAEIERNPDFLYQFAKHPRRFEEFIAASYEQSGDWDKVTLTPRSRDGGRDVIIETKGFGSLRILEQVKAYSPGNLVTHDDVRAMLFVLANDRNANKGIITTTSDFQKGVLAGPEFAPYMPQRLEVKNGAQLVEWLKATKNKGDGPAHT